MTRVFLFALLAIALFAIGCATREAVRIDSTTEESFNSTYQQMVRSLSRSQQSELSAAVAQIAMMGTASFSDFMQRYPGGKFGPSDISEQIDGLTFDEILELASQSEVQARPIPATGD